MRLFEEVQGDVNPAGGSQPAEQKPAEQKPAEQKPAEQKPAEQKAAEKPAVPEKYEFKSEDGQPVDQELVGEFTGIAKETGLTQEQASKFYGLGQKLVERQAQAFVKHIADTRAQWVDEIKKDPVLGANLEGNLSVAKKAIAAADTDGALVKWLNESGAGDNPHLVRAFYKLGKMLGNDRLVTGENRPAGQQSGPRTFAYANSKHNG